MTDRRTSRAGLPGAAALLANAGPSGASIALAWHGTLALAIITPLILPVVLLLLVVTPAVWSRQPDRRAAAADVLDRMLGRAARCPASAAPQRAFAQGTRAKTAGSKAAPRRRQPHRRPADRPEA